MTKFGLITHLIDDVNAFRAEVKTSRSRQLERAAKAQQSDEDLVRETCVYVFYTEKGGSTAEQLTSCLTDRDLNKQIKLLFNITAAVYGSLHDNLI